MGEAFDSAPPHPGLYLLGSRNLLSKSPAQNGGQNLLC